MEAPVETVIEKAAPEIQVQNGGENEPKTVGPEKQVPEENAKPKITDKKATKKTKEEKRNKEEEKRIKLLLRTFEGIDDEDAKLFAIAKKYVQLAADNKSLEHKKNDFESKNEKLTKERDTLQTDYNKATLAKSKLENLCRELQRHSKLVKEECQLRAQEEEAKRKELSDRFQTTINDISQQMQDNFKRNEQLKLENEDLAVKLKGLVSQYETREEHVDKVVQHKQLELQLSEAKMAQQSLQFNEMKEKSLMEKQELLKDSLDYRKRYEIMVLQEKELKAQLAMYTERFDDFQSTLNKSNEVFATFKTEMDKMSKTIKKLEKENKILKSRSDNTNRSLLAMLEERSSMETQIQTLTAKNSKLENLCRAMQKGVIQENKESSLPEKTETVGSSSTNNDNSNERTVDTNGSDSSKEPINTDQVPSNDQEQRKRGEPVCAEIQNGGDHVQEEELKNDGETVNNGQQENRESHNEETPVNNQQTDGETHSEEKPESDSNQSPESENTEVSKEDEKNEPTEVSESPSES